MKIDITHCYTKEEFIDLVNKSLKGTMIIYDESMMFVDNDKYLEEIDKLLFQLIKKGGKK